MLFSALPHNMSDELKTVEAPLPELDERSVAKKYGLKELVYPDSGQIKALSAFLTQGANTGRCGPVPKTAALMLLEFLQGTINRQNITKGPRMAQSEFDILQAPYYLAARIVAKIQRTRREGTKETVYQNTHLSLLQFVDLLNTLLDPATFWMRLKEVPPEARGLMAAMAEFLVLYPEQRRKGRAL